MFFHKLSPNACDIFNSKNSNCKFQKYNSLTKSHKIKDLTFQNLKNAKKVFDFLDFFFVFLIFFIDFFKKNLDLIFSILDLEISIPDLENSKRAFRKKTPNLRKINPQFSSIFRKNFRKNLKTKFPQNKDYFP